MDNIVEKLEPWAFQRQVHFACNAASNGGLDQS